MGVCGDSLHRSFFLLSLQVIWSLDLRLKRIFLSVFPLLVTAQVILVTFRCGKLTS